MPVPIRRRDDGPTTTGWEPLREIADLQQRMSQVMDSLWDRRRIPLPGPWSPAAEMDEQDDAYVVEAELPGFKRDEVSVELSDGSIRVHAQMSEQNGDDAKQRHFRHSGRFDYALSLPADADRDNIEASLENGMLTLRLPKLEQAKPRRIEISGGD